MSTMDKFYTRNDPFESSEIHAEEKLPGLWIVLCRFIIYGDKLFIDKELFDDSDLAAWHFTAHGSLFIEDNDDPGIVYTYDIENGFLLITPEYGGNFGYSGKYDYYIRNGEATLSRRSVTNNLLWLGSPQSREVERFILVRYQGKDFDYREMKKLHYQKAISEGAIPINIEWEKQYLLEDEKRFLERLSAEKGIYIDELRDEMED